MGGHGRWKHRRVDKAAMEFILKDRYPPGHRFSVHLYSANPGRFSLVLGVDVAREFVERAGRPVATINAVEVGGKAGWAWAMRGQALPGFSFDLPKLLDVVEKELYLEDARQRLSKET